MKRSFKIGAVSMPIELLPASEYSSKSYASIDDGWTTANTPAQARKTAENFRKAADFLENIAENVGKKA